MAIFVECRSHHFLPAAIWADMLLPEYLCCFSLWREVPQGNKVGQRTQKQDGKQHNFFENLVVCALHEIDVRSLLKHRAR